MNKFSSMIRACAFLTVAALQWSALPTADAQTWRQLCSVTELAFEGEPIYCLSEFGDGMWGQLTMVGTQHASIAVRQIRGLACQARGYDDTGSNVGEIWVPYTVGAVDEACFRDENNN